MLVEPIKAIHPKTRFTVTAKKLKKIYLEVDLVRQDISFLLFNKHKYKVFYPLL